MTLPTQAERQRQRREWLRKKGYRRVELEISPKLFKRLLLLHNLMAAIRTKDMPWQLGLMMFWTIYRNKIDKNTIPAIVIDIKSLLIGEYSENEVRKDFTVSERVETAKAIENELGNRQGQRTDKQLVQNFAQLKRDN